MVYLIELITHIFGLEIAYTEHEFNLKNKY